MNCEVCLQPFNLTNRYPMELPCCNENICKECQQQLAGAPQQETFQCPVTSCGERTSCQTQFKINKALEKLLRESLSIFCDNHPNELAEFYCKDHNMLVCTQCTFQQHQNHQVAKINKKILTNYNKIILDKLEIEYKRIGKIMTVFEAYQKNQMTFTATMYLKKVNKALEILAPTMKNQEDMDMIKFLNQNLEGLKDQNQLQQIPQQVQPVKPFDSLILKTEDYSFIQECFGQQNQRFELLFRGSRDTFAATAFHSKCDDQGPTLTVIKSELNQVFGGYASVSWRGQEKPEYKPDDKAFIFSVDKKTKHIQYQNYQYAIRLDKNYGPIFGGGSDIIIKDNCNNNNDSFSDFGKTYSLPNGMQYQTEQSRQYFAGSYEFKVTEIEVFKVSNY